MSHEKQVHIASFLKVGLGWWKILTNNKKKRKGQLLKCENPITVGGLSCGIPITSISLYITLFSLQIFTWGNSIIIHFFLSTCCKLKLNVDCDKKYGDQPPLPAPLPPPPMLRAWKVYHWPRVFFNSTTTIVGLYNIN